MTIKYINRNFRKTIPIYEKINPVKLMHFTTIFGDLCHTKFTCKILTKKHENTWIFQYKANHRLYITVSFCDKSTENFAYAVIQDFIFPPLHSHQQLDNRILKLLIQHMQCLDIEMLIFQIKHPIHISLCRTHGFKPFTFNEMALSLKTKFIPSSKRI
ncbi:hypothetical protein QBE52_08390 [Clostridiaceae bacterium 35-E11]